MCVVSMIGDGWSRQLPERWPNIPWQTRSPSQQSTFPEVSRAEFEALRKEIQELKALLLAAKKFDAATGQPECQKDEKVSLIKGIAKAVGVDMDEVFEPAQNEKKPPGTKHQ